MPPRLEQNGMDLTSTAVLPSLSSSTSLEFVVGGLAGYIPNR
jgi:hypothetical protein